MSRQEAVTEYDRALKLAQRELKELSARGADPHPAVLDELIRDFTAENTEEIPLYFRLLCVSAFRKAPSELWHGDSDCSFLHQPLLRRFCQAHRHKT